MNMKLKSDVRVRVEHEEGRKQRQGKMFFRISSIYPSFKNNAPNKEEDECDADLSCITVWQATREGLVTELDQILQEHPNKVNSVDSSGYSPLHVACKHNSLRVAEVLIKHKADLELKMKTYHLTPLHIAARFNAIDVCRLLLQNGANKVSRDCKDKTPLHIAARRGNVEIAKLLLESGNVDVNILDEDRLNSLHEAIMHKQTSVVPLLLKFGANVFAEDINGSTSYHYAASEGLVDTMNILLRQAMSTYSFDGRKHMTQCRDTEGNTALHMAVQNNKLEAVRELWEQGAEVNIRNRTPDSHFTPLHIAAVNGNSEIVEFLLNHDARVDSRDKDFMTPLHRAVLHNRCQVIECLIKRGSDINAKNKDQLTPLMAACSKGNADSVKLLLSYGAQIMEVDVKSRTALHIAVESGTNSVVELLMEHNGKALLPIQTALEQTAMHIAAKRGDVEIAATLISNSCPLDGRDISGMTPLHIAAEYGQEEIIDILVEASLSELNDEDADGYTPLMVAAKGDHFNAVYTLLKHGANVCSRDENACTPLIIAAKEGNSKIIKLLLQNYSEIDATDKLKNSALHIAAMEGQLDTVDVLLKHGASATLKNSYGKTPLDMAVEYRQSDIAILLLNQPNWEDLMEVRDDKGLTPMIKLIDKVPEAAKKVMDNCVKCSRHRHDDIGFTVTYDFKYIDPGPDDPMCKKRRVHLLQNMVSNRRSELLSHPLVQNILILKWRKFGRLHFYFNLTTYLVYLTVLTIYVTLMPRFNTSLLDDVRSCPIILNESESNNQSAINYYKKAGFYSSMVIESGEIYVLKYSILSLVVWFVMSQLYQLLTAKYQNTIFSLQYNMTWLMLVSTMVFLLPLDKYPCEHQWRAGWISTSFAWSCFVMYLRGLDSIGIYVVMMEEVMFSLSKVMFLLVIEVMSFAQAFYITMSSTPGFRKEPYNDPQPLSTLSMMLGEINFVSNFVTGDTDPFRVDSYILITMFMVTVPLALMNLLLGIAVGDIEKIQNQAYIRRLSIQIDEICLTETRAFKSVQRYFYQRYMETKPNIDANSCMNKVYNYVHGLENAETFISDEKENLIKVTVDEIKQDVSKTKYQLAKLQTVQRQTQEMVRQLCEQLSVNTKLDSLSVHDSLRVGNQSRAGIFSRLDSQYDSKAPR